MNWLRLKTTGWRDWQAIFENVVLRVYDRFEGPLPKRVVHVGAGIGEYAVLCAERGQTVVALEADMRRAYLCRRNTQRYDKVTVIHQTVTSLAQITTWRPDYVVIDAEGAEYTILRSGRLELPEVMFEYHAWHGHTLAEALSLIPPEYDTSVHHWPHRRDIGLIHAKRRP